MRSWLGSIAALLGAILLAIVATTPPGPKSADAPPNEFSATRAMADVRRIARAPHPTGSAENARVRTILSGRLREMGLETSEVASPLEQRAVERLDAWRGRAAPPPPAVNIVATLPGRDRTAPAVLMMAHYDSVWGSPGAADDAAGVAAILETVRAIQTGGVQRRDLIVLLTDAEELGLQGARAFFARDPRRERVGVIVNLETRGGGGRAAMFETGPGNGAMMQLFGEAVARPVATSLSVFVYEKLPNSTDYTVPKKLGVPGFNFAFIGRPGLYHSPEATPERVDAGSVQDMGDQALDLTRALLNVPALPAKSANRTFFDAYGLFLIGYPPALGWVLLGLAVAGYAASSWRRGSLADVGRGAAATMALILVAGMLLYAGNLVSGAGAPMNYYDRLAAIPRLQWQALLLSLAAVAVVWGIAARRAVENAAYVAGMAAPLLLLAGVVQVLAPTAGCFLTVPLLLGGVAAALHRLAGSGAGVAAGAVAAALGVGYLLGLTYFLLQAVGSNLPVVAALPLALTAVLLVPLFPLVARRTAWGAAAVLAAAAVGIALWVRLDPVASSAAVYSVFS